MLTASLLKKPFTTGCCMKKIEINFQIFSLVSALLAAVQNFSLAFLFPNRNTYSSLPVIYNYLIIKNGVPSIQLPK